MNKRIIALMLSFTCLASPALAERYTTQVPVTLTFDGQTYTDTIEIQWEMDAPAIPEPESALQYGNSGDAVSKLQQDLKALGYFSGSVTGFFGSSTQKAVSALQKANGLAETGMADAQTLAKIEELLGQKNDSDNEEETPEEKYSGYGFIVGGKNMLIRKNPSFTADTVVCVNEYTPCRVIDGFYNDASWWWYIAFTYEGVEYRGYMGYKDILYDFDNYDAMAYVADGGSLKESDLLTKGYVEITKYEDCSLGYARNDSFNESLANYVPNEGTVYEYIALVDGWYRLKTGLWLKADCAVEINPSSLFNDSNQIVFKYGDTSPAISTISAMLTNYLGGQSKQDNVFDISFEQKVRVFQHSERNGKPPMKMTGVIDMQTLNAILQYCNVPSAKPDVVYGPLLATSDANLYLSADDSFSIGSVKQNDVLYYIHHENGYYETLNHTYISDKAVHEMTESETESYLGTAPTVQGYFKNVYSIGYHQNDAFVLSMQKALKALGYYNGTLTGYYDGQLCTAVNSFALANNVYDSFIESGYISQKIALAIQSALHFVDYSTVYNVDWFSMKDSGKLAALNLERAYTACLTDLRTGYSFNIHIQAVGDHLDVEPLTSADTSIMCLIYNVSSPSSIDYHRRPVILTTSNGYNFACSIYGQPHGAQDITDNQYDGQFCVHFLNSKTHSTQHVDPDHAAAINEAVALIQSKGGTVYTSL